MSLLLQCLGEYTYIHTDIIEVSNAPIDLWRVEDNNPWISHCC